MAAAYQVVLPALVVLAPLTRYLVQVHIMEEAEAAELSPVFQLLRLGVMEVEGQAQTIPMVPTELPIPEVAAEEVEQAICMGVAVVAEL